ncbi:response regulator [Sunxiuqinia sp. A32]|uniref:response regulator n=1 Tax=Sunxiuqinia sp. A32 TaxID=3461496 RepID=UPI004045EEAB
MKSLVEKNTETYDLTGITILVAEDEQYNFIYLRELLSDYKANIIRAANGLHAIKLCEENQDIDVVLMDIRMPVMDGYESTKKIKEFRPELPIIAQTAFAMESDRKRALVEGCDDYISKPIRKNILVKKIYNIVNRNS